MQTQREVPAQAEADPVGQFFTGLAEAGYLATFDGESATLRFDLVDAEAVERWYVVVHDGSVTVARQQRPAEAIVRIDRAHFAAIIAGRLNAQAALLRGLLTCEGSMAAVMTFQRCLPGPPGSTGRVAPISGETAMAGRRTR
jgi:predicted lipid carrier protein YhbT